jgi:hypothetical protein
VGVAGAVMKMMLLGDVVDDGVVVGAGVDVVGVKNKKWWVSKAVGVGVEVEPKEGKAGSPGSPQLMMERKLTAWAWARAVWMVVSVDVEFVVEVEFVRAADSGSGLPSWPMKKTQKTTSEPKMSRAHLEGDLLSTWPRYQTWVSLRVGPSFDLDFVLSDQREGRAKVKILTKKRTFLRLCPFSSRQSLRSQKTLRLLCVPF